MYSSANPAAMISDGLAASMPRTFIYRSTHTSSEITAVGFFKGAADYSPAGSIGMRVGDIVINILTMLSSDYDPNGTIQGLVPGQPMGFTTLHSVISCTLSSTAYGAGVDATVGHASL